MTVTPASPTTGQTVTANVTSHDADGNPLTTSYQWTRNGTDISGQTGSTLNLATAGNGDRGDLIRVRVTVNDGTVNSSAVTSSPVTVANTAPVATVTVGPAAPDTAATLTATATKSDADADTVSLHYVWKVNGTTRKTTDTTALTDTFDLSVAGNGDAGDTVSVEVTPNDGTVNGTLVSAQVVVASSVTVFASDLFSRALTNTWGSADVGGAYTLQGTAADYDTTGTTGTIALTTGAANRSAVLASVLARDVDISFRVALDKVPVGGSLWSYGLIRRINTSNEYRAVLRVAAGGGRVHPGQLRPQQRRGVDRHRGPRDRPERDAGRIHPHARAVQRREPDDDPHARLGGRHDGTDDVAVHRDQHGRRTAGRRRRRPPQLPRQRCEQHSHPGHARRSRRDLHRAMSSARQPPGSTEISARQHVPERPSGGGPGLNGSGIVGAS